MGFTTYTGTVTAASEWDGPRERKQRASGAAGKLRTAVPRGRRAAIPAAAAHRLELASALAAPRLERAIGVLYLPETERASHYFHARLPAQFDFVLHVDETRAVEPLERNALWEAGEVAETFPSGL